jgi:hypothetical protein
MKGANYSWMVCKGKKVIALTSTQREAEAEAARVGGSVHCMPHKNPPDAKFEQELGGGYFSKAYGAPDPSSEQAFYSPKNKDLFRLNYGVENVSTKLDRGIAGAKDVVDVAKTIIALARVEFNHGGRKPDKQALAFLPSIRPVRLDFNAGGQVELIYKMPVYKIWRTGGKLLANSFTNMVYEDPLSFGGRMTETVPRLERAKQRIPEKSWNKVDALIRVYEMFNKIMNKLPIVVSGLDLHDQNAAVDKRGNLILLDPFVAEMKVQDAIDLWTKLGWYKPGRKKQHAVVVQRPKIK